MNNWIPADSYQLPSYKDSWKLLKPKIETKMAGVHSRLWWSLMNDSRGKVKSRTRVK